MNVSNELQTLHDEVEYWELIQALLTEQEALVKQIVRLRMQINRLHVRLGYAHEGHMGSEVPYPEPASDIVRDFNGFPAMRKLQDLYE
jgi:hypothetical protein